MWAYPHVNIMQPVGTQREISQLTRVLLGRKSSPVCLSMCSLVCLFVSPLASPDLDRPPWRADIHDFRGPALGQLD